MIVSKREKVLQEVVAGNLGGVEKSMVTPVPFGVAVGRIGSLGVLLGSPRIVVGGTGIEGTTGGPSIVDRPGIAVGMEENLGIVAGRMPETEGTTGTGIIGRTATAGVGTTGTGGTGTVGTMATGGRTGNVGTPMGSGRIGNPGRPAKAGNANGPLGIIPAPIGTSAPELGVTPPDGPVGRFAIAVDGTIGAVSNKSVSISVAVGISILRDSGRVCKITFAHEYRGLGCW